MFSFSLRRCFAVIHKEFILMKRDPAVLIIMAILPLIIVLLTGLTVNINPKNAPTAIINYSPSAITSKYLMTLKNTGYFKFVGSYKDPKIAQRLLQTNYIRFILTIPPNFTHDLIRHKQPAMLLEGDGTDIIGIGAAFAAAYAVNKNQVIPETLFYLNNSKSEPFRLVFHRNYNPRRITEYVLVPGAIGLVLMLTMLMITTVIAFRDILGGTLECLLASPMRPSEILLGEIGSYILIGFLQLLLGLLIAVYFFHIPFKGKLWVLLAATFPYIIAELSLGLTIATFCSSQFQAVQLNNLFITFSIVLAGFAFPIFGMPKWAQNLSEVIPLTHFLRMLRDIMLKGSGWSEIWKDVWPLLIYCLVMVTVAIKRFRLTLR